MSRAGLRGLSRGERTGGSSVFPQTSLRRAPPTTTTPRRDPTRSLPLHGSERQPAPALEAAPVNHGLPAGLRPRAPAGGGGAGVFGPSRPAFLLAIAAQPPHSRLWMIATRRRGWAKRTGGPQPPDAGPRQPHPTLFFGHRSYPLIGRAPRLRPRQTARAYKKSGLEEGRGSVGEGERKRRRPLLFYFFHSPLPTPRVDRAPPSRRGPPTHARTRGTPASLSRVSHARAARRRPHPAPHPPTHWRRASSRPPPPRAPSPRPPFSPGVGCRKTTCVTSPRLTC